MITLRVSAAASRGLTQAHITLERADQPTIGPIPQTPKCTHCSTLGNRKRPYDYYRARTLFLSLTLHWLERKKRKTLCRLEPPRERNTLGLIRSDYNTHTYIPSLAENEGQSRCGVAGRHCICKSVLVGMNKDRPREPNLCCKLSERDLQRRRRRRRRSSSSSSSSRN